MLQKNAVPINFSKGLDKKTDPFQVAPGNFETLENTVFDVAGRMTKRNGFGPLTPLPTAGKYLTTYANNLTAIGTNALWAFSDPTNQWVNKGTFKAVELSTQSVVRNNLNQSQAESAEAANGLILTAYTDDIPTSSTTSVPSYKYIIIDGMTGQSVVNSTVLPVLAGSIDTAPKVFLLGDNFIVVYGRDVAGVKSLRYTAISSLTTLVVATDVLISTNYTPDFTLLNQFRETFNGLVVGTTLHLAYNSATPGTIARNTLSSALVVGTEQTQTGSTAKSSFVTLTADSTVSPAVIYVLSCSPNSTNGSIFSFNSSTLAQVLAPTTWISGGDAFLLRNIAATAQNGIVKIFYEVEDFGGTQDATLFYLNTLTVTAVGVVSPTSLLVRGLGLASKGVLYDGVMYALGLHLSTFQPSYFLIDQTGTVITKFAYQNGPSSYYKFGVPPIIQALDTIKVPYLIKDEIQAINRNDPTAPIAGVYSQVGISIAKVDLDSDTTASVETARNLQISGGQLYNYDGVEVVENGFNIFPEICNISFAGGTNTALTPQQYYYAATYEWSDNQGNQYKSASIPLGIDLSGQTAITANFGTSVPASPSSRIITALPINIQNVVVGAVLSAPELEVGTYAAAVDYITGQVTLSKAPLVAGNIPVINFDYLPVRNILRIPYLGLTRKLSNPVKIVIYRWSTANQIFYQITSITNPILNDPSLTSSFLYEDVVGDAAIVGNNILYTTGGVVENIAPPASNDVALFKSRVFLIDSEDTDTLWYSKQIIQGVPAEFSDLFTIYIPPAPGGELATGITKALYTMDDKLIIFKDNALYYITGTGPDNAGGNNDFSEPVLINSAVGCIDKKSIVLLPTGLMFQSNKGIWLLSRNLETKYIGALVERFTLGHRVINSTSIPGTNQVRLILDNETALVYDYFFDQWSVFTDMTGITSTIYTDLHTFMEPDGTILQETPGLYLDNGSPVLLNLTTGWMNLAGLQGFERFYELLLLGTYESPFKLNVAVGYDFESTPTQNCLVSPNPLKPVFEARIFPTRQKCESFQLTITEQYDPTLGPAAGEGLTLSGLNLVVGMKKGYRTSPAARSFGGG